MTRVKQECVGYLRLSDMRTEDALEGREAKLRGLASRIGWAMAEVIIENDVVIIDGIPKPKPASAWKSRRVITESGRVEYRVRRPGFERMLAEVQRGRNLVTEDLDRLVRQYRDFVNLLDVIRDSGASARSLSGNLMLTDGGTGIEIQMANMLVFAASKASADTSRRVAWGRERWAGKSYQGGRRPFGYRIAEGTTEHQRNLIIDEAEAAIIRECAAAVLCHGTSLRYLARDLRQRGIRTVTGAAWTATALRDTLLKPSGAGLQPYKDELREAPWAPVLERETWAALRAALTDQKRRTNGSRANEPRWLLSCYATCGACGAHMKAEGTARNRYYVCSSASGCRTRRRAADSDEFIAGLVVARLSRPDAADLLQPPPRKATDTRGLKAEARALAGRREEAREMFAAGEMAREDLACIVKTVDARMAAVDAQIAASEVTPDPLAEFRGNPAQTVWDALGTARQRQVVQLLLSVKFAARPPRAPFDARSIEVRRKH